MNVVVAVVAVVLLSQHGGSQNSSRKSTVEEFMNTCLDSRYHKPKPSPEPGLVTHCSPWIKRSCCTAESAQAIGYGGNWLGFNYYHCGDLSQRCKQQFIKDECFYQCSPNLGPFLVSVKRKTRTQQPRHIPFCQGTCDAWWEACKSDLTCIVNWSQNFTWVEGVNQCPAGTKCDTFMNIFKGANHFCESVWNNSYKVVPDSEGCLRHWFSGENPNEAVTRRAAEKLLGLSSSADATFAAGPIVWIMSSWYAFCLILSVSNVLN